MPCLKSLLVAVVGHGSGDEAEVEKVRTETVQILWRSVLGVVAHTQLQRDVPLHNHRKNTM